MTEMQHVGTIWLKWGRLSGLDEPLKERAIMVWLRAVTPGHIRPYLAAMNAPRIIVNTVSWTGLENFFLWKVRQQGNSICLLWVIHKSLWDSKASDNLKRKWKKKVVLGNGPSYLSRNPSASMVNRIENLLSTVNIGRLSKEYLILSSGPNIWCHWISSTRSVYKLTSAF